MASIHSLLQTPGCSSETTHAAPGPEAGAAINQTAIGSSDTSSVNPPEASTAINHPSKHQSFITPPFARYLVIKHQDKDKSILNFNSFAMQKALRVLSGTSLTVPDMKNQISSRSLSDLVGKARHS